jgi:serine protease Do
MNRHTGPLLGLVAIVSFLLGLVAAGTRPAPTRQTVTLRVPSQPAPVSDPLPVAVVEETEAPSGPMAPAIDFAAVAARLNRAVVNVDTASRGSAAPARPLRRYSTDDTAAPREGSGSGFIIDPNGYVLTNHHVVAGADRVTVTLSDGRSFRASVVGTDAATDVALLHIQVAERLPVAPLGDSDGLRVGEWVCAIGNPLGVYVHSVTVGVVSFLGRKLFDQSLDAYIQTDAAISVGNSGGPLINARGQVVGITTAVSAQAASIGFAIPIAQVLAVLPQLREHGRVLRGDLGASVTSITDDLRHALSVAPEEGALVHDVSANSPAARAGLSAYDVVVRADGQVIRSDEELIRHVAGRAPGSLVHLSVWRDGAIRDVRVKLTVRPPTGVARRDRRDDGPGLPPVPGQAPLGISIRELVPELASRLRIDASIRGVLVTEVDPAGPAQLAQVRTNHVIREVNRVPVPTEAAYRRAMAKLKAGDVVALLVYDRVARQHIISTLVVDPSP